MVAGRGARSGLSTVVNGEAPELSPVHDFGMGSKTDMDGLVF